MTKNKNDEMSYEEAIKKLEEIVQRLENDEIPLEESLSSFQEGISLSRFCREKLAEIEYRVEYLLKEEEQQSLNDPLEDENTLEGNGDINGGVIDE